MHLVLEYPAFVIGFRYYVILRRKSHDSISSNNRLSIILGAIFGALFLSRLVAFFKNPILNYNQGWVSILNNKNYENSTILSNQGGPYLWIGLFAIFIIALPLMIFLFLAFRFGKENKKTEKIFLILAGIYLLIGLGNCGFAGLN